MQKKRGELTAKGVSYDDPAQKVLENQLSKLFQKKIPKVFASIAKRLCAWAVIEPGFLGYFDPLCDITQEAIDQLNEEYLKSIKTCPTCNQSIKTINNN